MNACHKPLISCFVFVSLITMNGLVMADNADDIRLRVQKVGKLNIASEPAAATPAADAAPEAPAAEAGATPANESAAEAPATETSSTTAVAAAATTNAGANNDVAQLYQASCFACHGTGVLEAPKLGDKAAWEPRIAQGNDIIMENVIKGFNAMPPRGATTLDDDTLAQIVAYMVESVQ